MTEKLRLLPTPAASEAVGGGRPVALRIHQKHQVRLIDVAKTIGVSSCPLCSAGNVEHVRHPGSANQTDSENPACPLGALSG